MSSRQRRAFSAKFKAEVVLSLLTGAKTQAELCRQHEVSPNLMDVFTRSIRGWFLSRRLDGDLTLIALKRALEVATPEIHHSDQGGQYAARDYMALLQSKETAVSMAAVGCPEENGFAERLMRTIKEEHVSLAEYRDINEARLQIGQFLTGVYQTKRIHSSLSYLTPTEFEAAHAQKNK